MVDAMLEEVFRDGVPTEFNQQSDPQPISTPVLDMVLWAIWKYDRTQGLCTFRLIVIVQTQYT
jgi:hypothetical protein